MRGTDSKQDAMFSYVSPETRVPPKHPLRSIKALVSEALALISYRRPSMSMGPATTNPAVLIVANQVTIGGNVWLNGGGYDFRKTSLQPVLQRGGGLCRCRSTTL